MRTLRLAATGIAAVLILSLLAWPAASPAVAAAATTFSGQATAVKGSIAGVEVLNSLLPCTPQSAQYFCIIDTGPLTATQAVQGGANEASLACYPSGTNCVIESPLG